MNFISSKGIECRNACVVYASGKYKTMVPVKTLLNPETQTKEDSIQNYTMLEGELLVDADPPTLKRYAGDVGFIDPAWDADIGAWVEGATEAEMASWEKLNPEHPSSEPTQLDRIEAQTTYTAMMTDTLLEG